MFFTWPLVRSNRPFSGVEVTHISSPGGLRIRVTDVLGMLAEDVSHEETLRDFPYLELDDIRAVLAYAARQADHTILQPA